MGLPLCLYTSNPTDGRGKEVDDAEFQSNRGGQVNQDITEYYLQWLSVIRLVWSFSLE